MINRKETIVLIGNHHIVIYNFRKELIQRLVEEGYRVVVMLPITQESDRIKALGCELIDISVDRRGMNPIRDLRLYFRYKRELKRINPSVVLTYTVKPNIYGGMACRILKIPYIGTITGVGKGITDGGLLTKLIFIMYRFALKKAGKVFFQNTEDKKLFIKHGIAEKNNELVHGSGVSLETFYVREFPKETEPIRFIFIARLTEDKGTDLYLEAAEFIKKKYSDTEFYILGFLEENYKEKIQEYVKKEVVLYYGMQDDVGAFLQKCQCLIHPSKSEGMSNICLEAAASGRAVIASDIPGCRETVLDKESGYLHKNNDCADLIQKIEKFIQLSYNDRMHMGLNGRKKMEEEFSREYVVDAYIKAIRKIKAEGKGGDVI